MLSAFDDSSKFQLGKLSVCRFRVDALSASVRFIMNSLHSSSLLTEIAYSPYLGRRLQYGWELEAPFLGRLSSLGVVGGTEQRQ
jgi:hypothetical protein